MGGGHALTRPEYDQHLLVDLIKQSRDYYHLDEIWLEPGEAPVLNAGSLHSTVLDIFQSGEQTVAILDVSATAHMPDVLEMPYRPDLTLDGTPSRTGNSPVSPWGKHLSGWGHYRTIQLPSTTENRRSSDFSGYGKLYGQTTYFNESASINRLRDEAATIR